MEFADNNCSVIPDFIANCGMARVFRYLMNDETPITDEAIFHDVFRMHRRRLEPCIIAIQENVD